MVLWLTGEYRGQRIQRQLEDGTCTVGRAATNDLPLPSQTVSRAHAELRVKGDRVEVVDLGSTNGTRVNGAAASKESPLTVRAGDTVEFGSVSLQLSDRSESSVPTWTDEGSVSESLRLSREETGKSAIQLAAQDTRLLELLFKAGQLMVDPQDPQETFDRVLKLVESAISAGRIIILEKQDGKSQPVQRAARVKGERALSPLMLSSTMVRTVIDEGASLLTGDAQADERFRNQQSIMSQDLRSAMAAPLVHNDVILGALYVDTADPVTTYSEQDLRVLTLLGQMLGAKIANARLVEEQREIERLRRELETAAVIQRRLLPEHLPDVPGYELVARQETCEDVGGDLYDAGTAGEGRMQFLLGDVSGKGIGAALLMADVLGAVRVLREDGVRPDATVLRLDRHLLQTTQAEHYITLFLGELDQNTHRLHYVNSGHPPALLVAADGTVQELGATGMPAGLLDIAMPTKYELATVDFPPGGTLVVYSDGISEAESGDEQFGEGRLLKCLQGCAGLGAADTLKCVLESVEAFIGDQPQPDDVTLLVVHRKG